MISQSKLTRVNTQGAAQDATQLPTAGVAQVVSMIRRLKVALHKSETLYLHTVRRGPPMRSNLTVTIAVGSMMKYNWTQFVGARRVLPEAVHGGRAVKGALRGAPAAEQPDDLQHRNLAVAAKGDSRQDCLQGPSGILIRGGEPSRALGPGGEALASLYQWRGEALERGEGPLPRVVKAKRSELHQALRAVWKTRLEQPTAGHAVIAAVKLVMEAWIERRLGTLSFRLTQVLSAHRISYPCRTELL